MSGRITKSMMYATSEVGADEIEWLFAMQGQVVTNLEWRPLDPFLMPHLVVWYADLIADNRDFSNEEQENN